MNTRKVGRGKREGGRKDEWEGGRKEEGREERREEEIDLHLANRCCKEPVFVHLSFLLSSVRLRASGAGRRGYTWHGGVRSLPSKNDPRQRENLLQVKKPASGHRGFGFTTFPEPSLA